MLYDLLNERRLDVVPYFSLVSHGRLLNASQRTSPMHNNLFTIVSTVVNRRVLLLINDVFMENRVRPGRLLFILLLHWLMFLVWNASIMFLEFNHHKLFLHLQLMLSYFIEVHSHMLFFDLIQLRPLLIYLRQYESLLILLLDLPIHRWTALHSLHLPEPLLMLAFSLFLPPSYLLHPPFYHYFLLHLLLRSLLLVYLNFKLHILQSLLSICFQNWFSSFLSLKSVFPEGAYEFLIVDAFIFSRIVIVRISLKLNLW